METLQNMIIMVSLPGPGEYMAGDAAEHKSSTRAHSETLEVVVHGYVQCCDVLDCLDL